MLYAIPKDTRLARPTGRGCRLDYADVPEFGTNVIPLKIGREELREGYVKIMSDLYDCDAYFGRLDDLYLDGNLTMGRGRARWWKKHPLNKIKSDAVFLAQAFGLFARLMKNVPEDYLRKEYRRRLWGFLKRGDSPGLCSPT
jgi:hypothetical protein